MASITSAVSGSTVTYVITDEQSNTATVTAKTSPSQASGVTVATSGNGVLVDAQTLLTTLLQMLSTGLRPNVIPGTTASFQS